MKYLISTLVLILGLSTFAQVNTNNNLDSIVKMLEAKIELEQDKVKELDILNSELKNQQIIYKAKEDYFAAALADQSTRFALIVTALIAFLSIISFSWYKIEKRSINKKINSFKKEFKKMQKENIKLKGNLNGVASHSYLLISQTMTNEDSLAEALEFLISGALSRYREVEVNEKKEYDILINILNKTLQQLTKIIEDPKWKEYLKKSQDETIKHVNEIQKCENEKVKDLCAKFRVSFNSYLE